MWLPLVNTERHTWAGVTLPRLLHGSRLVTRVVLRVDCSRSHARCRGQDAEERMRYEKTKPKGSPL